MIKKVYYLLLLCCSTFTANAQFNLNLLGHLPYPSNTCAGIWQYVDSLGNEYALVGVDDRVAIVDVTNPVLPVEVFSVPALPGQASLWRELKTYGKYAYAVSEGGGGLIVIDLSNLPAGINSKHWYGDGAIANQLGSAHTIAVTDGYAYIFGTGNLANGGAVIVDLADPWNPTYVGQYSMNYIHDGYIRNDTLWAGEIYAGQFSVIDVSDKSAPVLLTTHATPGQFCHNTWLSDNSHYLFTTDEVGGQPLGSFDVSNLSNIDLIDVYLTDSMPTHEVHNVRVLNDFLINPSYGSQLTICDAARPDNIIEIANYPTGSFLCWDASPYLPSGHIIVADVDGGVYILEPNYIRACYLEGDVTDSLTGLPVNNVSIRINPINKQTKTNLLGEFKTGYAVAGLYDIEFRKPGYVTKLISGVSLTNGQLTQLSVLMSPFVLSGTVTDQVTGIGIAGAEVYATDGDNNATVLTGANGNFSFSTLSSGFIDITATKWGYYSLCQTLFADGTTPLALALTPGYYDDFITDLGWTVNSTAIHGIWERGVPIGTSFGQLILNPDSDVVNDCGNEAFVTGNGGGSPNFDNVDDGTTELISPVFDLSTYTDPYINYTRWFSSPANVPPGSRDTLFISLSDGSTAAILESVTNSTPGVGTWVTSSFRVLNFMNPGNAMQLHVSISDKVGTGNYLEAGFDKFYVSEGPQALPDYAEGNSFILYPNPGNGTFQIDVKQSLQKRAVEVQVMDLAGRVLYTSPFSGVQGTIYGTHELAAGIYLVCLKSKEGCLESVRLVKAR